MGIKCFCGICGKRVAEKGRYRKDCEHKPAGYKNPQSKHGIAMKEATKQKRENTMTAKSDKLIKKRKVNNDKQNAKSRDLTAQVGNQTLAGSNLDNLENLSPEDKARYGKRQARGEKEKVLTAQVGNQTLAGSNLDNLENLSPEDKARYGKRQARNEKRNEKNREETLQKNEDLALFWEMSRNRDRVAYSKEQLEIYNSVMAGFKKSFGPNWNGEIMKNQLNETSSVSRSRRTSLANLTNLTAFGKVVYLKGCEGPFLKTILPYLAYLLNKSGKENNISLEEIADFFRVDAEFIPTNDDLPPTVLCQEYYDVHSKKTNQHATDFWMNKKKVSDLDANNSGPLTKAEEQGKMIMYLLMQGQCHPVPHIGQRFEVPDVKAQLVVTSTFAFSGGDLSYFNKQEDIMKGYLGHYYDRLYKGVPTTVGPVQLDVHVDTKQPDNRVVAAFLRSKTRVLSRTSESGFFYVDISCFWMKLLQKWHKLKDQQRYIAWFEWFSRRMLFSGEKLFLFNKAMDAFIIIRAVRR